QAAQLQFIRAVQRLEVEAGEQPRRPSPHRELQVHVSHVPRSAGPFYGEDFYCEIPRSFRHLSFYIFDRDVFRRDSIIGKVAIQKEDLQKYHNRDTWFQLQHVDADSEVQVITDTGVVCHKLATRIVECQGLPIVNGQCDPYATVTLAGPFRSEAKKTKVKRKTNNPQFDEVFYFEVGIFMGESRAVPMLFFRVDLWNASNLKFGDEFLGELRIPLKVLRQSSSYEAWYFLQPRDNGSKSLKPDDLGSLRLNVVYTEDHVFSSDYYSPLRDLLLKSADVEVLVHAVACGCGQEVPPAWGPAPRVQPVTRAQSGPLAAKAHGDTTQRWPCSPICQSHKPCEVDPVKLKDGENLENNMENLRQYVDRVFHAITESGVSCPTVMCDIFFSLREAAAKRFQGDPDVRYTAVSSFIFLRFFAPAILSPNLFQLTPHHTDPQTSRTLTLISKTVQTLGSLSKSKSASFKESYMATFYEFFNEQKYADAVKNFLDLISSSGRRDPKTHLRPQMFQVIQPERALYIQANNCVEAKDWIDILTKVSQCNQKRLTVYHPSAYLSGHWLCCRAPSDSAPGCSPCTGGLPANIQLDIDGDRETERIYSLFNSYMSKLEKMQEACGSKSVYDGPEQEEYSTFVIDDPQETYKTLKQVIAGVGALEQEHAQYKRDKFKKTKYGSQEHPIGDKSFQNYIRQQSETSTHSI
uniref:Uncharacterized protein n=1 Tax=Colobus angolensis palliatus TaxID=336983 RepID=A0A2K5IEG1_COLAP